MSPKAHVLRHIFIYYAIQLYTSYHTVLYTPLHPYLHLHTHYVAGHPSDPG